MSAHSERCSSGVHCLAEEGSVALLDVKYIYVNDGILDKQKINQTLGQRWQNETELYRQPVICLK